MKRLSILTTLALLTMSAVAAEKTTSLDTESIEALTGLKGTLNEKGKVFKVSLPRTDVKVEVDGWAMPPFMGLTSWAAFTPGKGKQAMVMGDLVLFQDEVNPVMSAALENGLEVTALHNHFFFDDPRVYFMHIGGEGDTKRLAGAVGKALDTVKEVRLKAPAPAKGFGSRISATNDITPEPLEMIMGSQGQRKDGMLKFVIGRKAKMTCDCEVGKDMGVNTWAAFAGTDDSAVVDGDFAMLEDELQGVLKALRLSDIDVVAIHNHMVKETPRIVFLHYWGRGKAVDLAKGIRKALDTQGR